MQVPRSDGLVPDRFVEIDLDWFEPGDRRCVESFVERVAPLLSGDRDRRGVVLNTGFLVDVITEFTGRLDQHLPVRSRRYARWREHGYAGVRHLVRTLREVAVRDGLGDLSIGVLAAGVGRVVTAGDLYDLASDWCDRHPELYPIDISPLPGPDLDARVPLAGDDHRYASRVSGIADGTPFADFLADQWAAVAAACELDLVHLRDGFWGPMLYTRRGPYGVRASSDPDDNETWTVATRDLFAAVKAARPDATVMAYTSGVGATGEWRNGCLDTAAVLAGGGVDILVDQTWGGAWQDWWDDWWKGWTYQHANLLSHAVAVRTTDRPVRHYKLIETWDGWEPFDTVHLVPEKLRWAMWAWSHAAVVTPDGLEVPDGTYVSWMNDRDRRLLDEAAVRFVAGHLDDAECSASRMTAVGGPLVAFDSAAIATQHRERPHESASEHVEDAAALLMKWGTPILGATAAEWLGDLDAADGALLQLGCPTGPPPPAVTPAMSVGRADLVAPDRLAAAGAAVAGALRPAGFHREAVADPRLPTGGWVHLAGDVAVDVAADAEVLAEAGRPTLVGRGDAAWWQPPELADPANPLLPRSQYGSVASAGAAARWWTSRRTANVPRVTVTPPVHHLPVTVQWWCRADEVWVLAGNLETGWVGDARTPRRVELEVVTADGTVVIPHLDVPGDGCVVAGWGRRGERLDAGARGPLDEVTRP